MDLWSLLKILLCPARKLLLNSPPANDKVRTESLRSSLIWQTAIVSLPKASRLDGFWMPLRKGGIAIDVRPVRIDGNENTPSIRVLAASLSDAVKCHSVVR